MHGSIAALDRQRRRPPRQGDYVTRVNVTAFDRIMRDHYGAESIEAVAKFLDGAFGTVQRIRTNPQQNVGGSTVSCIGRKVTQGEFFEIFEFLERDTVVAA